MQNQKKSSELDFDEMRAAVRRATDQEKIERLEQRIQELEAEVRRLERMAVYE